MMLFSDYTFRTVALGSTLLGLISGVLGSFAVLRKQSLLGDLYYVLLGIKTIP